MNCRKQKIEFLRRLAAGQLSPEDLRLLMAVDPWDTGVRIWWQKGDVYSGIGGPACTEQEMQKYIATQKCEITHVIFQDPEETDSEQ